MTTYNAKNFADRAALEVAIIDKTTDAKEGVITGTVAELSTLQLSHGMVVWGIPVVASDYVEPVKTERPQRGELHKHGINLTKNNEKD